MTINIYNEYAPLKKVIIGDASRLFFPDTREIDKEQGIPLWKKLMAQTFYRLLKGKRVPKWLTKPFQKELLHFEKLLKNHQVEVHRVRTIQQEATEELGLAQMYARDSTLCVGHSLIEGNLQMGMRQKERRGYQDLIAEIRKDNRVVSMPQTAPAYLEGGDVLVDYPNVFVGTGRHASNLAGVEWLRQQLDDSWNVIPVPLKDDSVLHLDCCLTIIGPKTAIICREVLEELPQELEDYSFIEIDKKSQLEMAGNVLVLGNKKVVVQRRHKQLQEELRARGFTPLPLSFTWHALLDGAFRCASCPLERGE